MLTPGEAMPSSHPALGYLCSNKASSQTLPTGSINKNRMSAYHFTFIEGDPGGGARVVVPDDSLPPSLALVRGLLSGRGNNRLWVSDDLSFT